MSPGREVGAAAVEFLAQAGARRFYTVPGESFLPSCCPRSTPTPG